ncbi:hypothetical protein ACUIJ5_28725 (plasmid) [Bacillus toyonensis]
MYHKLYLDAYNDEEWPFEDFNQGLYVELFKELENYRRINYCKEAVKEISFFIALYLKKKIQRVFNSIKALADKKNKKIK